MKESEEIIKIHLKSKFVDKTSLNINIFDNVLVKHKDDRMKWKYMKVEITRAPCLEYSSSKPDKYFQQIVQ